MKKNKTSFFCQHCGYMSPKWLGKCPSCNGWNCFVEELVVETDSSGRSDMIFDGKPLPIEDIPAEEGKRTVVDITEMDRVLGGGIVSGSAVLVGGEPGIGKSTLLLQMMQKLAAKGLKVLYVSGEESARQIKLRSNRVGASAKELLVLVEVSLEKILEQIRAVTPRHCRYRFHSDGLFGRPDVGARQRRTGARSVFPVNHVCEETRHSSFPDRSCDKRRSDCRSQSAGTYG